MQSFSSFPNAHDARLAARWRAAGASARFEISKKLHAKNWLLVDRTAVVGLGGEVVRLPEAIDLPTRLDLFEAAFGRSLAALSDERTDWTKSLFADLLRKIFLESCKTAWLDGLKTADFQKIYTQTVDLPADRRWIDQHLEKKFGPLRSSNLIAWVNGKKRFLNDLLRPDERVEPFQEALFQFLKMLDSGELRGESSLETFFRRLFFCRCVDFWRRKTTMKKRMPTNEIRLEHIETRQPGSLTDQIDDPDLVKKLTQKEIEFKNPKLKQLLANWRTQKPGCFFLIFARVVVGLTAPEIFQLLQDSPDLQTLEKEMPLDGFFPPLSEKEWLKLKNRWATPESLASRASDCLKQLRNNLSDNKNSSSQ